MQNAKCKMSLTALVMAGKRGYLSDTKGLLISNVAREFAVGLSRLPTKRGYLSDTEGLIISNISRELPVRAPHRELPVRAPHRELPAGATRRYGFSNMSSNSKSNPASIDLRCFSSASAV